MISTTILFASVILLLFIYKKFGFFLGKKEPSQPPRSAGSLPLIGHLVYLRRQPATILMKWAKTNGKMFLINLGPLK